MVETILNVDSQPSMLRIETSKNQSELKIPEFVKVLREVTTDDRYASGTIARNGWKMPQDDIKAIRLAAGAKAKAVTPAEPAKTKLIAPEQPKLKTSLSAGQEPAKTQPVMPEPATIPPPVPSSQ